MTWPLRSSPSRGATLTVAAQMKRLRLTPEQCEEIVAHRVLDHWDEEVEERINDD